MGATIRGRVLVFLDSMVLSTGVMKREAREGRPFRGLFIETQMSLEYCTVMLSNHILSLL